MEHQATAAGVEEDNKFQRMYLYFLCAFLAMEPLDSLLALARECGGGSITEEAQRFIWENCVSEADQSKKGHAPYIMNFMKKQSKKGHAPYIMNFMKKVITEVESAGGDVLDELYEGLSHYLCSKKDAIPGEGNAWIVKYVSFVAHDCASRLVVPLRCSLNMLDGDTGCFLWPSSLFMSEFILSQPELFADKSCFEVGSGVGLVGICLEHVKASEVILTDGDLSTLTNLKLNLKMNQLRETDVVKCIHMPWESTEHIRLQEFTPDVILGTDIIYDPSTLPHLVRLLSSLLQRRKTQNHLQESNGAECHPSLRSTKGDSDGAEDSTCSCRNGAHTRIPSLEVVDAEFLSHALESGPVAFIACVVRNVNTFEYFIDLVRRAKLAIRELTKIMRQATLLPYMKAYRQTDVKLLLISRWQKS
ncbi:Protein-lysine N-methyltransferase EEF2KMT-like protein [Drosera capensis]